MKIKRAALGREAHVGDLYNASTDTFCGGLSVFTQPPPQSLVNYEPCPQVKCSIDLSDSRSGRCRNLGLIKEEQLSILGLEVPLLGCAKYLAPEACIEGENTVSFMHRNRFFAEKLNISYDIKPYISLESAQQSGATHVVYEVEYGSNSVIALSFQKRDEEDIQSFGKSLALHMLKALAENDHGGCSTNPSSSASDFIDRTRFEFYTDVSAMKQTPQTLEEGAMFIKDTARSVKENTLEVTPTMYTLLPLGLLQPFTNQLVNAPQALNAHDDSVADAILGLLQQVDHKEISVRRLLRRFEEKHHFFSKNTICCITEEYQVITTRTRNLKQQVSECIRMYRLGNKTIADILTMLRTGQSVFYELDHFFTKFGVVNEKLIYLERCEALGAYIATDLLTFQNKLPNGEYFVFFTKLSQMDEKFAQNQKTFEKLCGIHNQKCILFDNDMHHLEAFEDHCIVHYVAGCSFEEDVCRLDILLQDYNVIKIDKLLRENAKRPNSCARLQVICPKSLLQPGCDGKKREWVCYYCGTSIGYGFNQRFYCECGESDPFSSEWYCNDPHHEMECVTFERDVLTKEMEEVQRTKEFNILLIGETGSGKSTWINSIANYVIHDNLTTAAQYPLTCLIPSSFTIQTDTAEVKRITVGNSDNEVFKEGQSATQKPQTYTFMFNNALIRLIDVPGVCDTRGPEQDQKNFDLILQELQTITELHAICILLAPDATRLTLAFLYCINELLTHLHKTAAKNIVFCFTKTRQTFYRAGQTLPILMEYLIEFDKRRHVTIPLQLNTMYYFDNEAFRLLCAIQNGVAFSQREQEAYQESWNISANETIRFLNYVLELEPHQTREMISLNEARRIIISLTVPLANITENINTNLRLLKAAKQEVELLELDVSGLEEKLYIKQITLKAKSLSYPQTVCAGPNCTESMTLPETGEKVNFYKRICHSECYLEGIEPNTFPNPKLKNCDAMDNGDSDTCLKCGCSWELHLHRLFEQVQEEVDVVDKTTDALLKEKRNRKIEKEDVLEAYDRQIEILEKRHKKFTEICAKFGAFLDRNSIVPYNDALLQYLDYAIKMAAQEAAVSGDRTRVESLQSFLKRYTQELEILKSNLKERPDDITVEDVMKMKEDLYSMDSADCNISEYLKVIEEANAKHYCRKDQYLDVEQLATKKKQKAKVPKLKRTGRWQKFIDWILPGSSKHKSHRGDPVLTKTLKPYQTPTQKMDSKYDKESGYFGLGYFGM